MAAPTNPSWVQGYVPTAGQWNSVFGAKLDYPAQGSQLAAALDNATLKVNGSGNIAINGATAAAGSAGGVVVTDTSNNISAQTALATGSTTARTLAARYADAFSVEDFGVVNDPSGTKVSANTAAYQAALTAAPGVARLRHRAGLSVVVDGLTAPAGTVWEIDGTLELAANSGTLTDLITITGADGLITGRGTINGNASGQTGTGNSGGIGSTGTPSGWVIEGVTITNCQAWPFNVTTATGCYAQNLTMTNCAHSAEFAVTCVDCWFIGCTVSGITDMGMAFYVGCQKCGAIGNRVSGCSSGIAVYADSTNAGCAGILIVGNIVDGNQNNGISVNGASTISPYHSDVTVVGNYSTGNGQANAGVGGYEFGYVTGLVVSGNTSFANGNGAAGAIGFLVDSTCTDFMISGNASTNEGQGGGDGQCFVINGAAGLVATNFATDNQATKTVAFLYAGTPGAGVVFEGNYEGASIGATFNVTLASDTIVKRPYRPAAQTITTPASGTAYQWTGAGNLSLAVEVAYNTTASVVAYAELDVSPDNSTWTIADYIYYPAATPATITGFLRAIVPPGWYYKVTATNATINQAKGVMV